MRPFTSLVVFALILILLRRVTGIPISIVGSLALTVVVNLIMENIGKALVAGDKVEVRGFGSLKVNSRNARQARNPRTGDSVAVPAKRVPYFKASNELKARLNGGD